MNFISRILLFVFVILTFTSCKNKRIVEVENIVKEWMGKIINFPDLESVCTTESGTTQNIKNTNNKIKHYKILFYTDSTGCTSCKLRLLTWKTYIEEMDSHVDFLFYWIPKDTGEFLSLLKQTEFDYPVYIDSRNELNKLNKFPDNEQYQCFLLNKDNKVISIGNPANNPQIWKLYKQIITGQISEKAPVTTVKAEQTEIELQDLKAGKTSEAVFVLKNTGTKPLVIQMVDASCGCTVPEWEKQPIGAGKSTEIKVKITPEKSEYFDKTVTVHCNTEEGKIMFSIRGTVNE